MKQADKSNDDDLKTQDFIVYKQMSFADMEIDDGGKYLEIDSLWVEFVQQIKVVNDHRKEIERIEKALESEFAIDPN